MLDTKQLQHWAPEPQLISLSLHDEMRRERYCNMLK